MARFAEEHVAALNARDIDAILAATRSDAVWTLPGGVRLQGQAEIQGYVTGLWEAFPDARWELHRAVEDATTVALEATFSGTHRGPLPTPSGPVPPTGRKVKFPYAALVVLEGRSVRSKHLYWDMLDMLAQLGLVPQQVGA
jgi:predicted ester cyclase